MLVNLVNLLCIFELYLLGSSKLPLLLLRVILSLLLKHHIVAKLLSLSHVLILIKAQLLLLPLFLEH